MALVLSATMALGAPLVAFASEGEVKLVPDQIEDYQDDAKDISAEVMLLVKEVPESEAAEEGKDATASEETKAATTAEETKVRALAEEVKAATAAEEAQETVPETGNNSVEIKEPGKDQESEPVLISDVSADAGVNKDADLEADKDADLEADKPAVPAAEEDNDKTVTKAIAAIADGDEAVTSADAAAPTTKDTPAPSGKVLGTTQHVAGEAGYSDQSDEEEMIITRNTSASPYSSSSVYYKGLTTYIKGLTDENYESVLKDFARNVPDKINKNTWYPVNDQSLIDPEKYSTYDFGELEDGYDSLLCWAAGASNALWRSGYGQIAVNPLTDNYFQNEDDLFNYFRYCFSDKEGLPDGAMDYFFKGTYPYQDRVDFSHLRDDAPKGGLLKGEAAHAAGMYFDEDDPKVDIIAGANNLTDCSAAVSLRKYSNGKISGGHIVGLAGIVVDETATDFYLKYKGLIIADSDDDTPIKSTEKPTDTDWDVRAMKAAEAKNVYAFYPITKLEVDGVVYWLLNDYSETEGVSIIMDSLYVIMDYRKRNHDDTDHHEDAGEEYDGSSADQGQVITISEIINMVETFMQQHSMRMYSPVQTTYNSYSMGDFGVYVKGQRSKLGKVYLDGKLLHEGTAGYRTEMLSGSLFRLVLGKELMQTLSKENHQLKLEFDGEEDAVYVFSVK